MLKKLFYASASVLMLAAAYHLGAVSAQAQGGATVDCGGISFRSNGTTHGFVAGAVTGRTYRFFNGIDAITTFSQPIPGTSPAIAVNPDNAAVMLANGDVYDFSGGTQSWEFVVNMAGGATPAAKSTWGQLKTNYRK
jgi:hypothetical protein